MKKKQENRKYAPPRKEAGQKKIVGKTDGPAVVWIAGKRSHQRKSVLTGLNHEENRIENVRYRKRF